MSDDIWARKEIESPCTKVCVIHPAARLCTGCLRTPEEITQWGRMQPEERRTIMAALPQREGQLQQRRGGRRGRTKA